MATMVLTTSVLLSTLLASPARVVVVKSEGRDAARVSRAVFETLKGSLREAQTFLQPRPAHWRRGRWLLGDIAETAKEHGVDVVVDVAGRQRGRGVDVRVVRQDAVLLYSGEVPFRRSRPQKVALRSVVKKVLEVLREELGREGRAPPESAAGAAAGREGWSGMGGGDGTEAEAGTKGDEERAPEEGEVVQEASGRARRRRRRLVHDTSLGVGAAGYRDLFRSNYGAGQIDTSVSSAPSFLVGYRVLWRRSWVADLTARYMRTSLRVAGDTSNLDIRTATWGASLRGGHRWAVGPLDVDALLGFGYERQSVSDQGNVLWVPGFDRALPFLGLGLQWTARDDAMWARLEGGGTPWGYQRESPQTSGERSKLWEAEATGEVTHVLPFTLGRARPFVGLNARYRFLKVRYPGVGTRVLPDGTTISQRGRESRQDWDVLVHAGISVW